MTCLMGSPVAAQPKKGASVLVLEAPSGGWKEGVQALVAELITTGYELNVRAARARSLDRLAEELQHEVLASGVSAGVSVTRTDNRGYAWLCRGVSPCERLEIEMEDGELSRSRLALAVVERLRPIELPMTIPPPSAPPPPAPPSVDLRPPKGETVEHEAVAAPVAAGVRPFRVWLGGGSVLSSGMASPLSWLSASLGAQISGPWAIEVGLAGSPLPSTTESYAGSLALRAMQGMAFVTLEPFPRQRIGLSLGLGGGALYLRERATPASGFDGFSRGATVAVVTARAQLQYRAGAVVLGLAIDPGMLVPELKVEAGTDTVLRIGRPWLALQARLGVAL